MTALLEVLREFFIWQEMNAAPCQRELYLLRSALAPGFGEKNLHWPNGNLKKQ